jgi:hypothetical protein
LLDNSILNISADLREIALIISSYVLGFHLI